MTDEELKSIEQTTALLVENGFVIKDTSNFIREIGNGSLEEVVNKLGRLQQSINEGVNAEVFGKDIAGSLDKIEEVVNSDAYFKTSPDATSFQNLLNDLRDKSSRLFRNTLKAEEILKGREENLKDIQKRISMLKVDKTIDDVTRTTETIKLSYALNHAKQAKEEAIKFYNDQKELSEKPLKANDIVEYKNELLQAVNALDNAFRKLSMEPEKMDKLAAVIRETRDKIVLFGFETQKNQREFDDLCAKYGLEKADAKTIEKFETPVLENEEEQKTEEKVVEEPKTKNITEVEDLVYELKRLNPDVEVIGDAINVDDPTKLVLPEGFKYTEGIGINNKIDDFTPYISAFVNTKEQSKDVTEEVKAEEVKEEPKKENKPVRESRVPSGRLSYKRTRRAIVAPYVKAILCYGGLGGMLAVVAGASLSPIGTAMLAGAGIGVIGQKIYNKMIDAGAVDVPQAQFGNASYELPVVGSNILSDAKALLKSLRKNKNRKKEESLDKVSEEEKVEAKEVVEAPEMVDTPEVVETPEVKEEPKEEEKKTTLFENFKNLFGSSLNSEVDSLDNDKKVQPVERLDEIAGEEYNLEEGRGGR